MAHIVCRRPFVLSEPARGLRIALTGGIGSGKSSVSALLSDYAQVETISADAIGHSLFEPGSPVVQEVVAAFGDGVSDGEGGIDRRALGALVFDDPAKREILESLTHPAIRREAQWFLENGTRHGVRIYDIPLYVEMGGIEPVDCVIAVETEPQTAVERLVEWRGMTRADAWKRVRVQVSNAQRREAAHVVLVNDTSYDDLSRCVHDDLWPLFQPCLR